MIRLQAKVRNRGLGLRLRLYAGSVCGDSAAEAAYTSTQLGDGFITGI